MTPTLSEPDRVEHQIHLYMAVAQAFDAPPYRRGDRHPVLVFRRQPAGSGHDFDAAAAVLEAAGWTDIDFTRAGIADAAGAQPPTEPYASRHARALATGAALLVYDPVVQPAPAPPAKKAAAS